MSTGKVIATGGALAAVAAAAFFVLGNDDNDRTSTVETPTEQTQTTELQDTATNADIDAGTEITTVAAEIDMSPDLSGLTVLEGIPVVRNGVEFTIDARGTCRDYSLEIRENMPCDQFLTELIQEHALTHNFFTAAKLSTSPEFIDAGLTGYSLPEQRHLREREINKRLERTTDEALAERLATRGNDTFYVIDGVSNLEAADAPLMQPE